MVGLLNLGSLILGLISWIIPVIILFKSKYSQINIMIASFLSFVCALVSLLMQNLYTKHLIDIADWSALMDTQGAVVLASIVLLSITIGLNGAILYRSSNSHRS